MKWVESKIGLEKGAKYSSEIGKGDRCEMRGKSVGRALNAPS